jgi:hypothetical protein
MAINACSINGFTIDARRCRDKFADLIPILRPPVGGGGGQPNGWAQQRPPAYYRGINPPRWDPPIAPRDTEQERVTVTAEIFGVSGTDTQSVVARPDLVTVTDIHIVSTEIGVNILNLKVN